MIKSKADSRGLFLRFFPRLCDLYLEQLFGGQLEFLQGLGDLSRLVRQPVGDGGHHGSTLATPALGEQEPDVRLGHQATHRLVEPPGVSETVRVFSLVSRLPGSWLYISTQ